MLEVSGLGKRYGPRWLFRNLDFQMGLGDRLVVLGHNGSGKSTLLRIIAGLLAPSEGKASLAQGDSRHALGMATVEMALYPSLTCAEHLEIAAGMRGCRPRTEELLDKVGLDDAANLTPLQMSSGMKARLKLALAIQADPSVLLLDEPGASLDEQGKSLLTQICDEQSQRGALLLATNDRSERALGNCELALG